MRMIKNTVARLFIKNRNNLTAFWVVGFCVIGFRAARAEAGPGIFAEKAIDALQTKFTITGRSLLEMRGITVVCTYGGSNESKMAAIVSSPQPSTSVSVNVDTAASSISISIHAVSTMQPADNAGILVFKMNNSPAVPLPITFVKAIIVDKNNASSELPITVNVSIVKNSCSSALTPRVPLQRAGLALFTVNGRMIFDSRKRGGSGFYCAGAACAHGVIGMVIR